MLTYTPYIYTMFQNIVADVQSKAGVSVHYEHGHILEIVNTLRGMSATPAYDPLKYPLIALLQDFDEKVTDNIREKSTVSLNIIIATLTDPKFVASRRLSCNFIPILYPLYDYLMESILKSGYFTQNPNRMVPHTKTDRMYWGKTGIAGSEANIFGDHLDAIEISNLTLTLIKKDCI